MMILNHRLRRSSSHRWRSALSQANWDFGTWAAAFRGTAATDLRAAWKIDVYAPIHDFPLLSFPLISTLGEFALQGGLCSVE